MYFTTCWMQPRLHAVASVSYQSWVRKEPSHCNLTMRSGVQKTAQGLLYSRFELLRSETLTSFTSKYCSRRTHNSIARHSQHSDLRLIFIRLLQNTGCLSTGNWMSCLLGSSCPPGHSTCGLTDWLVYWLIQAAPLSLDGKAGGLSSYQWQLSVFSSVS